MGSDKSGKKQRLLFIIVLAILTGTAIYGVFSIIYNSYKNVTNFEECISAGGQVAESYPEQCFWQGKGFVNTSQQAPSGDSDEDVYTGLAEQEALNKAKRNNTPARVVFRDGEALPVTMDYVAGRLNLHIRSSIVELVDVE